METLVPSLEKLTGPMNVLALMISQSLTKFLAEGHKAKNQNTQKPNSTSDYRRRQGLETAVIGCPKKSGATALSKAPSSKVDWVGVTAAKAKLWVIRNWGSEG